jgi:hypothetical protein
MRVTPFIPVLRPNLPLTASFLCGGKGHGDGVSVLTIGGIPWGRISSAVAGGTVFVMRASAASLAQGATYTEKVIYSFTGGSDGADPLAGLVRDGDVVMSTGK